MKILYNIEIDKKLEFYKEDIKNVIKRSLEVEGIKNNTEISISFVDDEKIKKLNLKYRNINKSTDVLSFPLIDFDIENINEDYLILGDIVISYETAQRQANELNHTLKREICFLVAHSMLHLLGYDHMTKEDEEVMIEKQNQILDELGIIR